jgi:formate dehydrogenase maturation protein FdhE
MIRTTFINGKEYYAISASIEAGNTKAPVQIYVDVSKLNNAEKHTIQRYASLLLDRNFKIESSKPKPKPWYQFW